MNKYGANKASHYDPAYVDLFYRRIKGGATAKAIAREIGITEQALHGWYKKYPELKDAVNRGKADRGKPESGTTIVYDDKLYADTIQVLLDKRAELMKYVESIDKVLIILRERV